MIVGDSGVGKTTLVHRYTEERFITDFSPTIGADFLLKKVHMTELRPNCSIALQILDMAGEKRFQTVLPYYGAGTQGLIPRTIIL